MNGVSQGIAVKAAPSGVSADPTHPAPIASDTELMRRFRLIWPDVIYQSGELKVVAYGPDGKPAAEQVVRTAGKPYALKLTPYTGPESVDGSTFPASDAPQTMVLKADGEQLCYLNVSVVDREGNTVPADSRLVKVNVGGAGSFEAIANGDPTCLEPFQLPQMHLFSGQLTVIVRSGQLSGEMNVSVTAKGLRKASVTLRCE